MEEENTLMATYLLHRRHVENVRTAASNIRIRSSELDDALDRAESSLNQLRRAVLTLTRNKETDK